MIKISKKVQHKLEILKDNKIVSKLWNHYKSFYQKEYQTAEEENKRLGKFLDNLKIIVRENVRFDEGGKSFKLHLNQYGDMDLTEFRKKMTGLKVHRRTYRSLFMPRRKRFLFDSVKKKVKKIKDNINKAMHPGRNRTNDSGTSDVTDQPVTRNNKITTKRSTTPATSESTVDYRPYMNPIENQGQCG
jgi:predicted nucleotidyltransferase